MRGGAINRGRGGPYQAPRGGQTNGRGRGGPQSQPRGGMNAAVQSFSPGGGAGVKRPREEGAFGNQQGNGGKRPRGGGQ